MAYNTFTLPLAVRQFDLELRRVRGLFEQAPPVTIGEWLRSMLEISVDVGVNIGTEKGRSEMMIAPIFLEVERQSEGLASFYSGVEFNVDAEAGLSGYCDYLFSWGQVPYIVTAPVIAVAEAKKQDMEGGIGQCLAEMVGAQRFNAAAGKPSKTVYGVVTTGTEWRFMQMRDHLVEIDPEEKFIVNAPQIVGILLHMIRSAHAERSARESIPAS